ncbi:MAG: glycosyltransferase family 39 protein [Candidatus Levybacteria bacterium]|nr:glycosyltransferase family 39 protein [Candidatus Levybacteria bacterium]
MKIRKSIIALIVILLGAAFLRLYRVSDYMTFLGDEGRDVLVVKGILEGNLTLLGPRASAGDFFTGPVYYYMMTPFLWLSQYDPVGPAIMVGLFGVATVFLIYLVGKNMFNERAGLIAAALYAVSPLVLQYSRSSWNPNTLPFFSLLTMYVLYKAITTARSWKYYILTGFLLGICIQLHYISLFLAVAVAISLFIMNWYLNGKIKVLQTITYYLQIFLGFLIGFSPFIAFEFRHDFQNTKAISTFVTNDTVQNGYATYNAFYEPIADVFFRTFARLVFAFPNPVEYPLFPLLGLQLAGLVIIIMAIAAIAMLFKHKNKFAVMLLFVWLIVGILLFGLYKKPIYDYYLVFMFPLPFLLMGYLLAKVSELKKGKFMYGALITGIVVVSLLLVNIANNPFTKPPNKQKDQVKNIAEFIISKLDNKPFNFALITPGNSDHAYRYYLEIMGRRPITIETPAVDPDRRTVTDQLIVVCEERGCKPLGHPLYEVAGFGPATSVGDWKLPSVEVYKLVHYKETVVQ